MSETMNERCRGCAYAPQSDGCVECKRWYDDLPDRFLNENDFFDIGDFKVQADSWPARRIWNKMFGRLSFSFRTGNGPFC